MLDRVLAALLEPDACLLELEVAGEHLALAGGDVAAQRLELGRRLAIVRRAIVPILPRDVARGRQPREPFKIKPRVFLERGQSGDTSSLRGEQFLLLAVDLPARWTSTSVARAARSASPRRAVAPSRSARRSCRTSRRFTVAARTSACALRKSASADRPRAGTAPGRVAPAVLPRPQSCYRPHRATTWPPTSAETGVMFPTT